MGRRRPWQVHFLGDGEARTRSRSFLDETTALAWAEGYVRDAGDGARAFVLRRDYDDEPQRDHYSPEHHVTCVGGEVLVKSWPTMSRGEGDALVRRALERAASGQDVVNEGPAWELARHHRLRLLP